MDLSTIFINHLTINNLQQAYLFHYYFESSALFAFKKYNLLLSLINEIYVNMYIAAYETLGSEIIICVLKTRCFVRYLIV